ncbi:MAG: DMT family transporter [Gammaproteobacteria bacterium]|nr:DMT family transporter [Gammaproteobacteria bacterium]
MPYLRVISLTTLTMIAFAGNSVLCRVALKETAIDAASFTSIRLISGALMLWLIVSLFRSGQEGKGNWASALALFAYAAMFSFAYINLSAAMGALLLFGAVQVTMIGVGLWRGEWLHWPQWTGLTLALLGLVYLLSPGLTAPPVGSSVLMLAAGVAWGIYSLRGKGGGDPTRVTAGNFLRSVVFALLLGLLFMEGSHLDGAGVGYAIASGAITSGLGYALWYYVLPELRAATAATVQLSVPVITAIGGVLLLSESISLRLVLASLAILGGIALVILGKAQRAGPEVPRT